MGGGMIEDVVLTCELCGENPAEESVRIFTYIWDLCTSCAWDVVRRLQQRARKGG